METESEGSVHVRWRSVRGARAYRLVWGPFTGQDKAHTHNKKKNTFLSDHQYLHISFFLPLHQGRNVETVEVTEVFHTLSRLQADTEYIVTIIPLYEGINEGPVATARFKIGRCSQ